MNSLSIYGTLLNNYLLMKRSMTTAAMDCGLGVPQAFVLLGVDEEDGRSLGDFQYALNCDPSNVTGIVDGLEKKGLAKRHENPKDRRGKVVKLEPAGVEVRNTLIRLLRENIDQALPGWSEAERQEFVRAASGMPRQKALGLK